MRGSFIPPKEVRELRDLTRYKRKLIDTIAAEKQRVEKILEDANIKLSSIGDVMNSLSKLLSKCRSTAGMN